jgi:hypothetical protein
VSWILEASLARNLLLGAMAVAVVALAAAWLRVGKRPLLGAAIGLVGLIGLLLLVSELIVTDREAVDAVLRQAAADVEKNDLHAVLRHIHSKSANVANTAKGELPKYRFEKIDLKNDVQITVDSTANPPTAEAKFTVSVHGKFASGGDFSDVFGERGVWRHAIVRFEKEGEAWKVVEYEHHDPKFVGR